MKERKCGSFTTIQVDMDLRGTVPLHFDRCPCLRGVYVITTKLVATVLTDKLAASIGSNYLTDVAKLRCLH